MRPARLRWPRSSTTRDGVDGAAAAGVACALPPWNGTTAAPGAGCAGRTSGARLAMGAAPPLASSGSSRMKLLPRPGSLDTLMPPPMRSARSREIDSPSPVPP
ncbi:hypothetical protein D3C71_917920 [compost metagenome]